MKRSSLILILAIILGTFSFIISILAIIFAHFWIPLAIGIAIIIILSIFLFIIKKYYPDSKLAKLLQSAIDNIKEFLHILTGL